MMNMANYVNFETTQTKIKINQKPGKSLRSVRREEIKLSSKNMIY